MRGYYLERKKIFQIESYLSEATRPAILIPVECVREDEQKIVHAARLQKYSARRWKNPDDRRDTEYYLLRKMKH